MCDPSCHVTSGRTLMRRMSIESISVISKSAVEKSVESISLNRPLWLTVSSKPRLGDLLNYQSKLSITSWWGFFSWRLKCYLIIIWRCPAMTLESFNSTLKMIPIWSKFVIVTSLHELLITSLHGICDAIGNMWRHREYVTSSPNAATSKPKAACPGLSRNQHIRLVNTKSIIPDISCHERGFVKAFHFVIMNQPKKTGKSQTNERRLIPQISSETSALRNQMELQEQNEDYLLWSRIGKERIDA